MKYFLLCFLTLFIGCKRDNEAKETTTPTQYVTDKRLAYCELSRPEYEAKKSVVSECDGLLFTGLHGVGCGYVDLSVFESNGRWYRDPAHKCGPGYESDSTISKDMITGVLTYLWWSKDLPAVNRMIEYGKSHDWVMGECKDAVTTASKCLMSAGQISLLYDMQKGLELGSGNFAATTDLFPANTGFRAHLDILFVLMSGSVRGAISDSELQTLKVQAERQPKNALYQAAYHRFTDGDQSIAIGLLADASKFPDGSLPTDKNYCTDYLYQRDDQPHDWDPCPSGKTFSGTDLIFAASVVDGTYFKKK